MVIGFRHTLHDPPHRFGEDLIHGPFSRFSHVHSFEEAGGATVMRDALDVELPWHLGGERVMRWWVAPELQRLFQFRHQALQRWAVEAVSSNG
jgi:ligand-binding SRPBCC domain-containing protein